MVIRKLDNHRRLNLSKEVCDYLGINPGDLVEMDVQKSYIIIRPTNSSSSDIPPTQVEKNVLIAEGKKEITIKISIS